MNTLSNSSVIEDRYLAYLAGFDGGQKVSEISNKIKAGNHPGSKVATYIKDAIKNGLVTSFVLAYPLLKSGSSILGGRLEVCPSCIKNVFLLNDWGMDFKYFFTGSQSKPRDIGESFLQPFGAGAFCLANEDNAIMKCRAINYMGELAYNFAEATIISLVALTLFAKWSAFLSQKNTEEQTIKDFLTERFGKIATRLSDLETNPEIQDCATRILQHQLEINKEIESLNLRLSWREVEQITQPVFDAARRAELKSKTIVLKS
jgi:hypothetical protein